MFVIVVEKMVDLDPFCLLCFYNDDYIIGSQLSCVCLLAFCDSSS